MQSILDETIPRCIKLTLHLSGYDSNISLSELNDVRISEIEKFINNGKFDQFKNLLNCTHSEYYANQPVFKFLPGHVAFLLALGKLIKEHIPDIIHVEKLSAQCFEKFPILKEMIAIAELHAREDSNRHRYSDKLRYFATYIFLHSGRSCYKMLQANLPLPSVKTICKYFEQLSH